MPLLLVVAAALIDSEERVLVQQRAPHRSMAGLWEFPGGKVEAGELPESALVRELQEELGIVAATADLQPLAFASEPLGERHLVMLLFELRRWIGEPHALDASDLNWARLDELRGLPMPPADLPLIEAIARRLA